MLSRLRCPLRTGVAVPSVTLVISAFNEAGVIREKLENAMALDYPRDQLEVMVISDASDDGTDEIVLEYADRNVRLCRQEQRLGKSAGLTRFCPTASGQVLVFTDANSMFRPDALRMLVRHFDNPEVGYTVGSQQYDHVDQGASADSENVYWSLELKLKAWESRLGSVVGADGAIYALRKELFEPLAPEDINDFLIPLKVVVKGFRGIFDPEAICFEDAAPDFGGEFRRKYRIVNRSLRAVTKVPQAFNPFRVGWFAFELIGHKVLRWLSPVFLALMLVSSAVAAMQETTGSSNSHLFSLILLLQLAGYGVAALYWFPPCRTIRLIYIAYYVLLVNAAAAVGLGLLASGRTIGTWKPQR
ncbi:glycosyltransferase family 2 protein [Roseiconus nitratireducens]|uniref:glycosyltransferase family 2 protein n=1 Tax=Roseiconus nitratireducens TaxID=2605748 RepID=UPI0013757332|nr:glycosyltransferase family 2 protein [Roseiconus nitratireducens]